jgi:hypothetical protein
VKRRYLLPALNVLNPPAPPFRKEPAAVAQLAAVHDLDESKLWEFLEN